MSAGVAPYSDYVRAQQDHPGEVGDVARQYVAAASTGQVAATYRTPWRLRKAMAALGASPGALQALERGWITWRPTGAVETPKGRLDAPLDPSSDVGAWLAAQTRHPDPAIAHLAGMWAARAGDEPTATVAELAWITRRSFRASAALERCVVAWRVQYGPRADQVACGECRAEPGERCADLKFGGPWAGFHADRRRNCDARLHAAVAADLRVIHAARRNHLTNPSTTN